MSRRTPTTMLRALPAVLLCAVAVAACGSSASVKTTRTAPARTTVTRTVTGSGTAVTSSSTTPSTPTTGTGTSTTSSTTTVAGAPECVASGLALSSLGGSGATGHLLLGLGLRNTSGHACRTGGYPGVQFLDGAGKPVTTIPDHTTDDFFGHTVLRELTLAPGALASFRLGTTDVASGGSSSGCVSVKGLQVIPPNDTATLRITRELYECGGTVSVSPLQVGTTALR